MWSKGESVSIWSSEIWIVLFLLLHVFFSSLFVSSLTEEWFNWHLWLLSTSTLNLQLLKLWTKCPSRSNSVKFSPSWTPHCNVSVYSFQLMGYGLQLFFSGWWKSSLNRTELKKLFQSCCSGNTTYDWWHTSKIHAIDFTHIFWLCADPIWSIIPLMDTAWWWHLEP